MSLIWGKIWRDLVRNKTRTGPVVLSTAVGVFALGLVFGLSDLMYARMTADHRATVPAHLTFWTSSFDQDMVEAIRREPGVADAEGEAQVAFRWKPAGETGAQWRNGILVARHDYAGQRMNLIDLRAGSWPADRTLALENQSAQYFGLPLGATVTVASGRYERQLPVDGVVRMATVFPPQFGGDATFYATPQTVAWLTGERGFNQLQIRLAAFSQEAAAEAVERLQRRLERSGLEIYGHTVTDPNVHWLQSTLDPVFLILGVLGALSLGLSAFLIINTMNAIIAQQVWQIGVMKVLGATFGRVVRIYLVTALIYGELALLLAIPLGAVATYYVASWLLTMINIDGGEFQLTPVAVGIQVAVGLAVPVAAALVPAINGARITPHAAISSYGLGGAFGRSRFDRLIAGIRRLPRPLALSLRNTFRRKARVAFTLITLVLSGLVFIVVMSVGNSLNNTIEVLIGDFGLDILVVFERPYRVARLASVTESVPGVIRAEVWDRKPAMLSVAGAQEREIFLWSLPPDSIMFSPRIVSGRGLLPDDERAILLNSKIAADENIRVGDEVTLLVEGRESIWTVVGLVLNLNNNQRDNFVPFSALARELGQIDRGALVMVRCEQQDLQSQQGLIGNLRNVYGTRGMETLFFDNSGDLRNRTRRQFDLLIGLMLAMALLAAVVGSFGLMGTMSINVVERSREIGVMRAIGATSLAIVGIFVAEGVLLGVLSWLLAAPLSYPGGHFFSAVVGQTLFQTPLNYRYSLDGMALWLAIVVVLSAAASLWPALRATRLSVRDVLAYE